MAAQTTPLALVACCLLALSHAYVIYDDGDSGGGRSWPFPAIQEQKKCNLAGRWVNELGSKMTIEAFDGAGSFVGSYMTAVSSDNKPIPPSPLHGVQQDVNARGQPTFGFTVNWLSTGSTTVFTGQCFVSSNGEETLKTMWLLRSEVATQSEDWKATKVGVNVFVRVK